MPIQLGLMVDIPLKYSNFCMCDKYGKWSENNKGHVSYAMFIKIRIKILKLTGKDCMNL